MNPACSYDTRRTGARVALIVGAATSILILFVLVAAAPARAAQPLAEALAAIEPADLVPGADRFGAIEGVPPAVPVYRGGELVGYGFLNADVVSTVGYSGKPIQILIGMDSGGTITGIKLYKHAEPIVLIGIPASRVMSFIDRYVGRNVRDFGRLAEQRSRSLDIISGATVTVMVIDDAIIHSTLKMARALGIGGLAREVRRQSRGRIDTDMVEIDDWLTLVGDGSVRRLNLSVGEVTAAFERAGKSKAARRAESDDPEDVFVDLFAALVSVPTIGRSLLGDAEYELLAARLEPGRHAVLIAGNGLYSFKGSGYVRGGIFDRIQLIQGDNSIRFRDRSHKRLGTVEADHAQDFHEVGLFVLPADADFDPTLPWRLELLVHRAVGALEKDFLTYDLRYALPDRYIERDAAAVVELSDQAVATSAPAATRFDVEGRHHHLFDPRTGRPARQALGVSVIARDATTADALSTAFCIMPEPKVREVVAGMAETAAWITRGTGEMVRYPA